MSVEKYIETEEKHEQLERRAKAAGLGSVDDGNRKKRDLGLCGTCSNATIVTRGRLEHQETEIRCRILERVMPPDILECSSYWKEGQMSLRDMGELAYYIDVRELPGGYR